MTVTASSLRPRRGLVVLVMTILARPAASFAPLRGHVSAAPTRGLNTPSRVSPVCVAELPREIRLSTTKTPTFRFLSKLKLASTPHSKAEAWWLKGDDWLDNIRSIPYSTVLRRCLGHILFNVGLAALFMALRAAKLLQGSFPAAPHSLAGAFLGLLVTFRTNSAYARFWEARIIWGGIMNTCRSLAIGAKVWVEPRKPIVARRLLGDLFEYPTAVMRQCRDQPLRDGEHPADVCLDMQNCLHDAALTTSWDGPMGLYELQLAEQARHVDKLVDATGALNRIICTPLPLAYSRHTSRFLTAWCTTLPFALGASVGALPTLATVAVVSWLVLGIDSIGQLLEQPFSQPANIGVGFDYGLPVETLARGVSDEIARIGKMTPSAARRGTPIRVRTTRNASNSDDFGL